MKTHLQNIRHADVVRWDSEESEHQDGVLMLGENGLYDFTPLHLAVHNLTMWRLYGNSWHCVIPRIKVRYYPSPLPHWQICDQQHEDSTLYYREVGEGIKRFKR